MNKAANLGEVLQQSIRAEKPYLIDANIGADMNPGGGGVWELPGLGYKQSAIGGRHLMD